MKPTLVQHSKRLSWLLRHGAQEAGLVMDGAGWALVADVMRLAELSEHELEAAVEQNDKRRFEFDGPGERIRAVQGHSLELDLKTLESSWERYLSDAPVFHGTNLEAARAILSGEGISRGARTHVHLAPSPDSVVGKRASVAVLLVVSPVVMRAQGEPLFVAPNGVVLARRVARACIVEVQGVTAAGTAALGELRALLGG